MRRGWRARRSHAVSEVVVSLSSVNEVVAVGWVIVFPSPIVWVYVPRAQSTRRPSRPQVLEADGTQWQKRNVNAKGGAYPCTRPPTHKLCRGTYTNATRLWHSC